MNPADRDTAQTRALAALRAALSAWECDASLDDVQALHRRSDALDDLERRLLHASVDSEPALRMRVAALQTRLENADHALHDAIRTRIRAGDGARALREAFAALPSDGHGDGYDALDMLLAGVLQIEEPATAVDALAPEMVFYQPTPAREVFALAERLALEKHDVVIDLGSGLGHVPLLLSICTPARCIGIELQAGYVESARRCAEALGLTRATFVREDARAAALSDGTVFHLYTPFRGSLLDEMLARLRREAETRRIRLCTLGPCTATVAREGWLRTDDALRPDRVVIFRSL